MSSPSLLEIDWPLPRGVRAAFTTRLGGASAAPWDSFNLGTHVGDDPVHVAANRARLRALLDLPEEPGWLNQVHGHGVADLDAAPADAPVPTADAAIAKAPGRACVIMVADCLPVLFATRDGDRIGAAHAGWRGLAAGVLESTVKAMKVPASHLSAWLGPAISQAHFEVGAEVRDVFVATDAGASAYFAANPRGRFQCDLAGLARRRLAALGVGAISGGEWCTFGDPERFYSHRRDAQARGSSGRLAALVWKTHR
jgi:YfiH family protein